MPTHVDLVDASVSVRNAAGVEPSSRPGRGARLGPWELVHPTNGDASTWEVTDGLGRRGLLHFVPLRRPRHVQPLSAVCHPVVAPVIAVGEAPEPHVVVARPQGWAVAAWEPGMLPVPIVLRILGAVADGLAAAHRLGVHHGALDAERVYTSLDAREVGIVGFEGSGGPAADVHALATLGLERLRAAGDEPGYAEGTPPWVQALLFDARSPEPARRPSAARIAEVFAEHGFGFRRPGPADVWRRARHLEVPIPAELQAWLVDGGTVSLVGGDEGTRLACLDLLQNAAFAGWWPTVRLHPSRRPWGSVEAALQDADLPGLPERLPEVQDLVDRAEAAAEALLGRAHGDLRVLVHDLDRLDAGTRQTIAFLHQRGASLLLAQERSPSWVSEVVPVPALDRRSLRGAVEHLLGVGVVEAVADAATRSVGGRLGALVRFVQAAVASGAVYWHRERFVADAEALRTLGDHGAYLPDQSPDELPPAARELGALVAELQPLARSAALDLAEDRDAAGDALAVLEAHGWLAGRDTLRTPRRDTSDALWASLDDSAAAWRRLAKALLGRRPVPWAQLGWALVGAEEPKAVALYGARCVDAASYLDPDTGADLATRLWFVKATPELAAARIRALCRAGLDDEAAGFGQAWLRATRPDPSHLPAIVEMARLSLGRDRAEAAVEWVQKARHVLDGAAGPPALRLVEAGARLARGQRAAAERALGDLASLPPSPDDPESWLQARGLLARARASDDPSGALALLSEVPTTYGLGLGERAQLERIRGALLGELGRPAEAARVLSRASLHRGMPMAERLRTAVDAAAQARAAGDLTAAADLLERAFRGFDGMGRSDEGLDALVALAQAQCELGRSEQARASVTEALRTARAAVHPPGEASARLLLADLLLDRRMFGRAVAVIEAAESVAVRAGCDETLARASRLRAEVAVLRREPDALPRVLQAHNLALHHDLAEESARCDALRALLLARLGHVSSVRQFSDQALRTAQRAAARPVAAEIEVWVAEAWRALGRHDEARASATRVLAEAEAPEHQWGRVARRARDLLAWSARSVGDDAGVPAWSELVLRIHAAEGRAEVLDELAAACLDLVQGRSAYVATYEDSRLEVVIEAGPGARRPAPIALLRRVLTLGQPAAVREGPPPDAPASAWTWLCAPLVRDGRAVGAVAVDIDPRTESGQEALQLRSLAQQATVALASVARHEQLTEQVVRSRELVHDLRNPLVGIEMMARALAVDPAALSPREAELLAEAASHALDLLQEAAGEPSAARPIDLAAAIEGWLAPLSAEGRAAGVEVEIVAAPGAWVRGRPTDLRRVVANLVHNAIKYSPPESGVTVRVEGGGDWVELHVDDGGPGIPDALLDDVFASGVQAPGAAPGQGLGLGIVRRICREHGGDVVAENRASGSRFSVRLPRTTPPEASASS